ncbi:hypothetical protein STEG23_026893 [Scotinomys teguina]
MGCVGVRRLQLSLAVPNMDDTVVAIPYGSRHIRLVLKGPDHLYLETKTLQGTKGENSLSSTGTFLVDNSTVDFQKLPDKEILRMAGPLTADFIIKCTLYTIAECFFSEDGHRLISLQLVSQQQFGRSMTWDLQTAQSSSSSTSLSSTDGGKRTSFHAQQPVEEVIGPSLSN